MTDAREYIVHSPVERNKTQRKYNNLIKEIGMGPKAPLESSLENSETTKREIAATNSMSKLELESQILNDKSLKN